MPRTIRCRSCREIGHNRASCPALKERVENLRSTYGSDHYMVSNYDAKQAKKKEKNCSYCRSSDHTRRTCGDLTRDRARLLVAQTDFRRRYIDALCLTEFVPGTVFQFVREYHDNGQTFQISALHMVTGINLSTISLDSPYGASYETKFLGAEFPAATSEWTKDRVKHFSRGTPFTENYTASLDNTWRPVVRDGYMIIIAPGCTDTFRKSLPASFVNGTDTIAGFFENSRGTIGRTAATFEGSIDSYEHKPRYDWIEANSESYVKETQDIPAFLARVEEQCRKFDGHSY
jgi:hypothetical protein